MAQLHQIVGGLLRDIAKARFGSDLYSRSIARYYEARSLLRQFPVPRTEIDEVELELKFAIDGISVEPVQNETREATLAIILERETEAIAQKVMDAIRETAHKLIVEHKRQIGLAGLMVKLRQHILSSFLANSDTWINSEGTLDLKAAVSGLKQAVESLLELVFPDEKKAFYGQLDELFESDSRNSIFAQLYDLNKKVAEIWHEESQSRIEIEVDRERLTKMTSDMICSIKIKSHVRNYVWMDVEAKDDVKEPWRTLTHE